MSSMRKRCFRLVGFIMAFVMLFSSVPVAAFAAAIETEVATAGNEDILVENGQSDDSSSEVAAPDGMSSNEVMTAEQTSDDEPDMDGNSASGTTAEMMAPTEGVEGSDCVPASETTTESDCDGTLTGFENSISGMLWLDLLEDHERGYTRGDGIRQAEENPLVGYDVKLYSSEDQVTAIRTVQTDADGMYHFDNIEPGTYVVGIAALEKDNIQYLLPGAGITNDNKFEDFSTDRKIIYSKEIVVAEDTIVIEIDAGLTTLLQIQSRATTILVNDEATLQAAIMSISSGGIIEVTDNISLDTVMTIPAGKAITIRSGVGGPYTIMQNATTTTAGLAVYAQRHFCVEGSLTIENITLSGRGFTSGGDYNGGIYVNGMASLMMKHGAVITGCYNYSYGGGVFVSNTGSFVMLDGEISGNTVEHDGAGIYTESFDYNSPADITSYANISISRTAIITDNRAGQSYAPPVNAADFMTRGSGTFNGTLLNNDNINHKNSNYSVTYVANNGKGEANYLQGTNASSGSTAVTLATRTDVSFSAPANQSHLIGWATSANGAIEYYTGETINISGHITLYARWETGIYLVYKDTGNILIGAFEQLADAVTACGTVAMDGSYTIELHYQDTLNAAVTIPADKQITITSNFSGSWVIYQNATATANSAYSQRHFRVEGVLTLDGISLVGINSNTDYNGGIHIDGAAAAVTIKMNTKLYYCYNYQGGGVYVENGTLTVQDDGCIFLNKAASNGGGIYTTDYSYINPAATTSYANISIADRAYIADNSAGQSFSPPSNAADFMTRAINPFDAALLNNDNINYRYPLLHVEYRANNSSGAVYRSTNSYDSGDSAVAKAFAATGLTADTDYVFDYWCTTADGMGTRYYPGDNVTIETGDFVLYAVWKRLYTVTFHTNGGNPAPASQSLLTNSLVTAPATITKIGHNFGGWYKEPSCQNQWDFSTDQMPAANLDLHAKWTKENYTIQVRYVDRDDNPVALTTPQSATYGEPFIAYPAIVIGKVYAGWYMGSMAPAAATVNPVTMTPHIAAATGDATITLVYDNYTGGNSGGGVTVEPKKYTITEKHMAGTKVLQSNTYKIVEGSTYQGIFERNLTGKYTYLGYQIDNRAMVGTAPNLPAIMNVKADHTVVMEYAANQCEIKVTYEYHANNGRVTSLPGSERSIVTGGTAFTPKIPAFLQKVQTGWTLNGIKKTGKPIIKTVTGAAEIVLIYQQDMDEDGVHDYTISEQYESTVSGKILEKRNVYVAAGKNYYVTPKHIAHHKYIGYRINGGKFQAAAINSIAVQSSNPAIIKVSADQTVELLYEHVQYTITVKAVDESGKTIKSSYTVKREYQQSFYASAPRIKDYTFKEWRLDGVRQAGSILSIDSVEKNMTAVAVFAADAKFEPNQVKNTKKRKEQEKENYEFIKKPNVQEVAAGEQVTYTFSGFGNKWNTYLERYAVSDKPDKGLDFVSAKLPAFTNGSGVTYDILYFTNKHGKQVLYTDVPAGKAFSFSAPKLAAGEYITVLTIEFGKVPAGFALGDTMQMTFKVWDNPPAGTLTNIGFLSYDVNGENKKMVSGYKSGSVTINGFFTPPRTGDNSRLALGYAMVGVSLGGIMLTGFTKRKKRKNA